MECYLSVWISIFSAMEKQKQVVSVLTMQSASSPARGRKKLPLSRNGWHPVGSNLTLLLQARSNGHVKQQGSSLLHGG